jgi:indolepyruvate ferredoxin oxidoreductase beta subunit
MKCDIIIVGVGGQGILTIAYLLDSAALARGMQVKQAEVHGMAQRGGAVYTHLRISDSNIISDIIPEGEAEMILGMEPLEVQRYVNFLSPNGMVITSNQFYRNISNYPEEKTVMEALFKLGRVAVVDSKELSVRGGSSQGQNMAMVGMATPWLPFQVKDYAPFVQQMFGRKGTEVVDANLNVIGLGAKVGAFYKELLSEQVSSREAYLLMSRLDPMGLNVELGPRFAAALKAPGAESRLAVLPPDSPCNAATLGLLDGHKV